jgi:hypothetical protein
MTFVTRGLLLVVALLATFTTGCGTKTADVAQAVKKAEIDSLINDFLAIEPRAKWPILMADVNDEVLVREFVAGAQEAGVTLTERQTEMVRLVIVPRLKERMALTVDKIDPNTRYLDALAMAKKMESDTVVWFKKYEPAVAELLKKANTMPELDPVTL